MSLSLPTSNEPPIMLSMSFWACSLYHHKIHFLVWCSQFQPGTNYFGATNVVILWVLVNSLLVFKHPLANTIFTINYVCVCVSTVGIGGRIERFMAGLLSVVVVCGLCIVFLMYFGLMCLCIWRICNACIGILEFL